MSTKLGDNRDAALKVGFEAIDWPYPITFEQYLEAFKDWVVRAIERDGVPIGTAFTHDGELHIAILPQWRRRWVTRNILCELFDMPKVIARPIEREDIMYSYLVSLGFKDIGDKTLILEKPSCLPQ
ncbi:hypothetical protein ACFSTI_25170 [Rhizorhabdus histidinilytica]|uniref:GNAT family N-acetyltransferase n=1 Tax=Rhizorhabdus histidinilytica TaxID=439228 RepID=A0A1T5A7I5_9SPHN|nr:hypothetical protein [Rhizorhabdus histidinilytica]SKB30819.1 hypothetical protein SAMN06295920_101665 [Rhizorhabdus histidinilytica]